MLWMLIAVFAAPVAGLVLAVVWWLGRGRREGALAGIVAGFTLAAGLLGVLADVLLRFAGSASLFVPFHPTVGFVMWYFDHRHTVPLVVGILGLVLLAFPVRSRRGSGVAELAPRGALRFTRARWLIAPAVLIGMTVLIALVAGATSQPDPTTGRYDMYVVDIGDGTTVATAIYGWFYSVPALIAMAVLVLVAVADFVLIARPPLRLDRDDDARVRRIRSRNVVLVATGALLLHLASVFSFLSRTASLAATVNSDVGQVTLWTPVAAMVPVFIGAAYVAAAVGVALWAAVALSAVGSRRATRVLVGS